jgi:hypothetical protein
MRWLIHLSERLGEDIALSLWETAFENYEDKYLQHILSSEWHNITNDDSNGVAEVVDSLLMEKISSAGLNITESQIRIVIENTPPIFQIKNNFAYNRVERELSAYDALHLRFDGLACLAEALINQYGKQGELIVYDLMVAGRLANSKDEKGSVEQFMANFTAKPANPNLFTAGLEIETIRETPREVVIHVRECEWARYFQERHPRVGYLMACSTDEVAYKSFNSDLRMRRTQTIMEGAEKCDFWIYAINDCHEA